MRMLAVVAAALVLSAASQAKGPLTAFVCGPERCEEVPLAGSVHAGSLAAPAGGEAVPAPGPFFRVELRVEGAAPRTSWYVPGARLVGSSDDFGSGISWSRLAPGLAEDVEAAAMRVRPYPPPHVSAAFVGERRVSGDPSTYLALGHVQGPFVVPDLDAGFEWIRLESLTPSPWTEAKLAYYPKDRVLLTSSGTFVQLPASVAARLEAARSLETGEPAVVPWVAAAVGLAAGLGLLALARRRPSGREVTPVH